MRRYAGDMAMNRWTICLFALASNAAAQPIAGGLATPITYSVNDEPTRRPYVSHARV